MVFLLKNNDLDPELKGIPAFWGIASRHSDNDGGIGSNSYKTFIPASDGIYFISVSGYRTHWAHTHYRSIMKESRARRL